MAGGLTPAEARARARREFGNPTAIEEQARDVWRWPVVRIEAHAALLVEGE
jgi:hypothetical protein